MCTRKRTFIECDAILCGPGKPHEMETRLIDGRLQRVYKNLPPSLCHFWLQSAATFRDHTYLVYEDEKLTYAETLDLSLKAAVAFKSKYQVQKGDRVAICSRNLPEFLVAFWACHLIGAVSVLINAWLPVKPMVHCFVHTGSKLIIVDSERADVILPALTELQAGGVTGFMVFAKPSPLRKWCGMQIWSEVMSSCGQDSSRILPEDPKSLPEDNAAVIFTSGTTGLPKGVLSTHRQFLTNIRNAVVATSRAYLRRGDDIPALVPSGPQGGLLLTSPLFHVTGLTALSMLATLLGQKIVIMHKWDIVEAVRLIERENIRVTGGVPSMVSDLLDSPLKRDALDTLLFGGSPAPPKLPTRAKATLNGVMLSQAYGMTETSSIAVGLAGEDYEERPSSTGKPCPVNDILIVRNSIVVGPGEVGEVWLKGPNVMKGYWGDPVATANVITEDGWFKSGDLGVLDEEGFLYIRDRIKDLIIRGGENIDSVSVENAIQVDPRISEVAAVGVPDERLGELVAAVVSTKPAYRGQVKEQEVIDISRRGLPRFAIPVMVIVQDHPFELTPSGKIIKAPLRRLAKAEWERRNRKGENSPASRL